MRLARPCAYFGIKLSLKTTTQGNAVIAIAAGIKGVIARSASDEAIQSFVLLHWIASRFASSRSQ